MPTINFTVDGRTFTVDAPYGTWDGRFDGQTWTFTDYATTANTAGQTLAVAPLTNEVLVRQQEERLRQEVEAYRLKMEARERGERRAEETFLRSLTAVQRKQIEIGGSFDVVGSEGNWYRIRVGGSWSGNITYIRKGCVEATFCCHPQAWGQDLEGVEGYLPDYDAYLAQKLMIEADEISFLRTTVCQAGRRPDVGFKHIEVGDPYGSRKCICRECENQRYRGRYFC